MSELIRKLLDAVPLFLFCTGTKGVDHAWVLATVSYSLKSLLADRPTPTEPARRKKRLSVPPTMRKGTRPEPGTIMAITGDDAALGSIPLTGVIQTSEGVFQASGGMEVVGADGGHVGRLKEIRPADILVDRTLKRDVYVPFAAVQGVRGEAIVLTIPAAQVDQMDWPQPPLLSLGAE